MDKLDIFELDADVKIQTTVKELQLLYMMAFDDGRMYQIAVRVNNDKWLKELDEKPTLIQGDIV